MIFFLLYNFVVAAAKVRVWMQVKACFQMSEWLNVDQKNLNDAEKKNWVKAKKKKKKDIYKGQETCRYFGSWNVQIDIGCPLFLDTHFSVGGVFAVKLTSQYVCSQPETTYTVREWILNAQSVCGKSK